MQLQNEAMHTKIEALQTWLDDAQLRDTQKQLQFEAKEKNATSMERESAVQGPKPNSKSSESIEGEAEGQRKDKPKCNRKVEAVSFFELMGEKCKVCRRIVGKSVSTPDVFHFEGDRRNQPRARVLVEKTSKAMSFQGVNVRGQGIQEDSQAQVQVEYTRKQGGEDQQQGEKQPQAQIKASQPTEEQVVELHASHNTFEENRLSSGPKVMMSTAPHQAAGIGKEVVEPSSSPQALVLEPHRLADTHRGTNTYVFPPATLLPRVPALAPPTQLIQASAHRRAKEEEAVRTALRMHVWTALLDLLFPLTGLLSWQGRLAALVPMCAFWGALWPLWLAACTHERLQQGIKAETEQVACSRCGRQS